MNYDKNFHLRWKYEVTLYYENVEQVEKWCNLHIGKYGIAWCKLGIDPAVYLMTGSYETVWLFKKQKDAIFFKLTWQ